MKIDILTIFPEMFSGPFAQSVVSRAVKNKLVELRVHNLRNWADDAYRSVDDRPYGGGAGMILRVDVVYKAVRELKRKNKGAKTKVILLDTKGKLYKQEKAHALARERSIILIAGHYEGVDHRVHEKIVDEVISIGEYVLTGGELPVMVVVDSLVRLLPGVINPESLVEESNEKGIEYPHYTRPAVYRGWEVPKVLLSGDHAEISRWRRSQVRRLKQI